MTDGRSVLSGSTHTSRQGRCLVVGLALALNTGLTAASQPAGVDGPDAYRVESCADTMVRKRTVRIHPDAASISVLESGLPDRSLTLRAGLLPDVYYLPGGDHALLTTRDAWVLRVDLAQARLTGQVQFGRVLHRAALSAPGPGLPSVLAVATAEPNTLVLLDENLAVLKVLNASDKTGRQPSRIGMVRTAQARDSFVLSLLDLPELWEISYRPSAPEIAIGMVHDFQYREGAFVPGYLNPQRITLATPAADFRLSAAGHEVLTVQLDPDARPPAHARLQVTHLDVRRQIAEFALPDGWTWPDKANCAPVPR